MTMMLSSRLIVACVLMSLVVVAPIRAESDHATLARQYCETVHRLPATLRATCCEAKPVPDLSAMCATQVEQALDDGAITLDAKAIATCAEATRRELRGCDWVGPRPPRSPAICADVIRGARGVGAACSSSLACGDGQYCRGASESRAGVCAEPVAPGQRCENPGDALGAFVLTSPSTRHPTCQGQCVRGQCLALVEEGGACNSGTPCAEGLQCRARVCAAVVPSAKGEACDTQHACADGLRCVDAKCATPLREGARCEQGFECQSLVCDKPDGAKQGRCANVCANPTLGPARFVLPQ